MPIQIPNLSTSECILLGVCGFVEKENTDALDYLRKQRKGWRIFRVEVDNQIHFVRVGLGGGTMQHCHIDVATPAYFDAEPPEAERAFPELQAQLEPLLGATCKLNLVGSFVVPLAKTPPFVQMVYGRNSVKQGETTIRMTAATLSIIGGPLNSVSWKIEEETQKATITVNLRIDARITESYLKDAFDIVKSSFERLATGDLTNAS